MLAVLKFLPELESIMFSRSFDTYYNVKLHAPMPHTVLETYRWSFYYKTFDFYDFNNKTEMLDLEYRWKNLYTIFRDSYK